MYAARNPVNIRHQTELIALLLEEGHCFFELLYQMNRPYMRGATSDAVTGVPTDHKG